MADWREKAACGSEDPELFFPIGNTGPAILQAEEAKQVCRRCEVREQCLEWALNKPEDHGVWGGLSEDERRALKRKNARAKVRASAAEEPVQEMVTVRLGPDGRPPESQRIEREAVHQLGEIAIHQPE
jgi:WhiB family redox-sensing transcriptional regulator